MTNNRSRRTLLAAGFAAAGLTALSGCRFTDPVIHSERHNTGATRTPLPTPAAEQLLVADAERDVAADCLWLATTAAVSAPVKAWATSVASAHATAATLLSQVDPLAPIPRTPEPVEPASHANEAAAVASIASRSASVAASHQQRLLAVDEGGPALLYASLLVTATWQAAPTLPPELRAIQPGTFVPQTVSQARVVLVERLHAAIQGYQAGLGVMANSAARTQAVARLTALTQVRDQQASAVRADGVEPPGPLPGYQQGVRPTNAATAAQLFGLIERGLVDAFLAVIAAQPTAEREPTLAVVMAQVAEAKKTTQPMQLWPGWT